MNEISSDLEPYLIEVMQIVDLAETGWTDIQDLRRSPVTETRKVGFLRRRTETYEVQPSLRAEPWLASLFTFLGRLEERANKALLSSDETLPAQVYAGRLHLLEIAERRQHLDGPYCGLPLQALDTCLSMATRLNRLVHLAEEREMLLQALDSKSLAESAQRLEAFNEELRARLAMPVLPDEPQ